jgi:hypothetical protein
MIIPESIKEYFPIATAFLGAFLAYIFGNRKYKIERFHKEAVESLKDFYSPVFHDMREIKFKLDFWNREEQISNLINFISKYMSKDTNLFKSYNPNLIDLFYDLDKALRKSKVVGKDEAIDIFNMLYVKVEKEYWDIQKSIYRQFPWYKILNKTNPIYRFLLDLTILFYDIAQFLFFGWVFIVYIIIFNKVTGNTNVPIWIINNIEGITVVCLSLFGLAVAIRTPYHLILMDYKRENKYIKNINKLILNKVRAILKNKTKKKNVRNAKALKKK